MGSISKKAQSLLNHGVDSAIVGRRNFNLNIPEIEELAKKRAEWSKDYLVDEPISMFRVEDPRIPALSNKMHKDCGCTAAYLFRQSIDKRPEWKE